MRPLSSNFMLLIAFAIAGIFPIRQSDAALFTINVETVAAESPGAGWFDITLLNQSGANVEVSGFTLGITLGGSGVAFTGVTSGPVADYIFGGDGTGDLVPGTIFPNTELIASDSVFNIDGFVTLGDGELVRLARVDFTVAEGAGLGLRSVTVDSEFTGFVDFDSNLVIDSTNSTFVSGGVDVLLQQGELMVPEPSSAALLLGGFSILYGIRRRRLA